MSARTLAGPHRRPGAPDADDRPSREDPPRAFGEPPCRRAFCPLVLVSFSSFCRVGSVRSVGQWSGAPLEAARLGGDS